MQWDIMKVKCPTCGKTSEYSETNPFRPFCSERCQTLDLGAWADERYKLPIADSESESENIADKEESEGVNEKSRRKAHSDELSPLKHRLN